MKEALKSCMQVKIKGGYSSYASIDYGVPGDCPVCPVLKPLLLASVVLIYGLPILLIFL